MRQIEMLLDWTVDPIVCTNPESTLGKPKAVVRIRQTIEGPPESMRT